MSRGKPSAQSAPSAATLRLEVIEIDRLRPHEEIRPALLIELRDQIRKDGVLKRPILVAEEDLVILDGHHRVEALRSLGARRIPAYLVDYASGAVHVTTWPDAAVTRVTKAEVLRRGRTGDRFPPKTTRHTVTFELKEHPTPLENLM